ncbi:NADP-dependent malic enzyme [Manduca sexta]|uniref:NADP-dependent malic enzyme n=1 Tax=Manduca sexta TaxID=7130 RepID=UPI001890578D|nr:NADP-dependent malic enzyme [Manduca sexta]
MVLIFTACYFNMFSIVQKRLLRCTNHVSPRAIIHKIKAVLQNPLVVQSRSAHEVSGTVIIPNSVRGIDHLKDPRLNKGLAFSLEERQALGIHGLLPPRFKTQVEQLDICRVSYERYESDFNKYIYLIELQDRNERLFFSLLDTDIEKYMPIVYTPTVGLACQRFGLIFRRARGLFITIHDLGHVYSIIRNWPVNDVRAIVFTDGERILGLGDLGAYGMGIPVGKLALYTALGGISPHQCLPIVLDVGTDNQTLLEDPLYIGLRHKRIRGKPYDDLMDEFMRACATRYGPNVLLQFEDFALPNAGRFLKKYQNKYCTFNDDIQGTAAVAVAGLMAAGRITKRKISDNIIVFLGAGSAANGIASLIVDAMVVEGLTKEQARAKVFMFDVDGLITSKRQGGVPPQAKDFAKNIEPEKSFEKFIGQIKATAIIGCSTVGGAFKPNVLKQMAKNVERPIIFALSNPTKNAECTPQEAYDHTEGRCVFCSGSPFPPVKYQGKEYKTGQGNNSYIFPGIALGVLVTGAHHMPDSLFLVAAKALAGAVSEEDLKIGRIYPPLSNVKNVSITIALDIAKMVYEKDIATVYPKPKDMEAYIRSQLYQMNYKQYLPTFYKYPELPAIKVKSIQEAYKGIMSFRPVKKPGSDR